MIPLFVNLWQKLIVSVTSLHLDFGLQSGIVKLNKNQIKSYNC